VATGLTAARGHDDAARRHQQRGQGRDAGQGRAQAVHAAHGQFDHQERRHRGARGRQATPQRRRAAVGAAEDDQAAQESVELYDKGGRAELAAQERDEIAIISAYLPKQMSDADVKAAISAVIAETGAAGMKDMGKVIGALKAKYAGQMDFGKASGMVKAALTG
jgi:hypothetical protein